MKEQPASTGSRAAPRPSNSETRIGVALVGCGYWGPNLARVVSENPKGELRWLVDRNPDALRSLGQRYQTASQSTALDEALRDPAVDAVLIATPVSTHFALAEQCLNAGKSVLIEKPMAQNASQCARLVALAREKGVTLMVDHTFIYTGAVRKIKEIVDRGDLGEIYYFDSVRVNLGLFQSDVNVVWDLAPHDLSIMDYVMAQRPVGVSAHGACHVRGSDIHNIAYLTLKFEDETLAHFHVNWLAPVKIRRIIIGGSKKLLVYDDLSPDEKIKIYDKGIKLNDGTDDSLMHHVLAGYRIGDLYVPNIDTTEALKRELAHFLDCVETGGLPETDGESGERIVHILEAAQESLAQRGAVVALT